MSLEGEVLFLSFGYALIGALLLVVVTKARLSWTVKAGAVVVTSAFYVVVFFRTQGLLGWSAPEEPPNRFQLLWARVVEPNIANKTPGAIHIWVESLDDANLPSGVPRAYRLPYSPALAHTIAVARDEIMNGHPQGGRALAFGTPESQAAPDGPPPGGPTTRARGSRGRSFERRVSRSCVPRRRRFEIGRVRPAAGTPLAAKGRAVIAAASTASCTTER